MRKLGLFVIVVTVVSIVMYLIIGFIEWKPYVSDWSGLSRFGFGALIIVITFILLIEDYKDNH